MNISALIRILEEAQAQHGDLLVTGIHLMGHPELTITGTGRIPAGPLVTATPSCNQDDLPERFLLEWEEP